MFTTECVGGLRRRARAAAADGRPAHLPGERRIRGGGDRHQDGPRLPPGDRAGWPLDDHRPPVARTTATRSGALDLSGKEPLRKPYTAVARSVPARAAPPTSTAARTRSHPDGCGDVARRRARTDDRVRRPGHGRRVHRRAGGRRHARRRRAVRRLLAQDRRGLPSLRRPRDRRRGDDRVRADGPLVRRRSLGRSARHRHRRQGHDERLRAVRVRRVHAARSSTRSRPGGSCTGSRGRTTRSAPRSRWRRSSGCATTTWSIGAEKLGRDPADELADALADVATVGDVRGLGMMLGDRARAPIGRRRSRSRGPRR